MPTLKPGTIMPTPEEDAAITAAALDDPDSQPLTDEDFKGMRRIGRPPIASPKKMVTLRLDQDLLAALQATGPGWQSRVNAMLRDAVMR